MERAIEVCTEVRVPLVQARRVLVDRSALLGGATQSFGDRWGIDLEVDLGAGASVRQRVVLELGTPASDDDEVVVPVFWEATGRARLFPQFTGELVATSSGEATRLGLRGAYRVPLGPVGRFGDGIAGRHLARGSLVGLVQWFAARLDAALAPAAATGVREASYAVAVSEGTRSELYIG